MQKTSIFVNPPLEYQVYHLNGGVLELGLRPAVHVHFWVLTTGFFGLGTRSMIYAGRPKRIFICRAPTRRAVKRVLHLSFGASLGGFWASKSARFTHGRGVPTLKIGGIREVLTCTDYI